MVMGGETSEFEDITSGVPQRSVLGPVLFLIFINDICQDISSCMRLLANDCLVYRIADTDEDWDRLQENLNKLTSWAEDWQMRFNVSKCYSMHLTPLRKKPTLHTYLMNDIPLTTVEENPYLGITIWHNGIEYAHQQHSGQR